jgi:hypothetical protein
VKDVNFAPVSISDFCLSKYTSSILIGWVAVTAAVSAIDFAGTVAFGVDYNNVQVKHEHTLLRQTLHTV